MSITYRLVQQADLQNIARVFIAGLNHRCEIAGSPPLVDLDDPEAWNKLWESERRPIFEHVARQGCTGWLAEQNGEVLGYGRSIIRDDVCQLTELFVLPDRQLGGLGRELLDRAFVQVAAPRRIILSNNNPVAMSRYMRSGVYPECAIFEVERKAQRVHIRSDLETIPIEPNGSILSALNGIDQKLLSYTRQADHVWLCQQRRGILFTRNGEPAGYAYAGGWNGPFAALDAGDLPAILARTETIAAENGGDFGLMVPAQNRTVMTYALENGFKLDSEHMMFFMADFTPPGLDRYICSMPGFFT